MSHLFPSLVGAGKAMCKFVFTLRRRTIGPVLLRVLFTRASSRFPSLVGTGKAVLLELLLLAAMVIVSHVFSLSVHGLTYAFPVP